MPLLAATWCYWLLLAATAYIPPCQRCLATAAASPPSGHRGECGDYGTEPMRWQVKAGNSAAHPVRAGYLRPRVDARVDARTSVVGAEWTHSVLPMGAAWRQWTRAWIWHRGGAVACGGCGWGVRRSAGQVSDALRCNARCDAARPMVH